MVAGSQPRFGLIKPARWGTGPARARLRDVTLILPFWRKIVFAVSIDT